ncbi:MAG: sugar phosphate isomerase/epimerase [Verrucomicrobiales bacterium]|jgi:sugar phosphate isomerase/epimerase
MNNRRHFLKSAAAATSILAIPATTRAEEKTPAAKSRFKLSLAAYSFGKHLPNYRANPSPEKPAMDMAGFLDHCATLDIDAAELTSYFLPRDCPRELALELKRKAHRLGLDISGGAIGNNFSFPAGAQLDEQFAYTEHWIKTYAAMGAPVIRVFAGHPKIKGQTPEDAEKNIITNLQHACTIASRHGVILGVENHDFTTDIDRMERILAAVDSPWFGLNFDSGNLAKTSDPYADLKRIAPHTVNAQIKIHIPRDGKKEPADFKRIVDILGEANYRGYLVLEYEAGDPFNEVPTYLAKLREAIA